MISSRRSVIQSRTHNETVIGIIGDAVKNVSPPGSITSLESSGRFRDQTESCF